MLGKRESRIPSFTMRALLSVPRRIHSVLIAGVVLIVLAGLMITFREDAWEASWIPFMDDSDSYLRVDDGKTRIALIETGGTHDEVAAALLHAFGAMKNAEMGVFFADQRFHMQDGIMDKFKLETPIAVKKRASYFASTVRREWTPDIIVSTTCEFDAKNQARAFRKLLERADVHLFCFIHHADRWVANKWSDTAARFHGNDRLDVVGLSAHTVQYFLNKSAPAWDGGRPVRARVLPPVFPVDLPAPDPEAPLSLAIQGDYDSGRRDYRSIFDSLGEVIKAVRDDNPGGASDTVDLHVLGHGWSPSVPSEVRDRVFFDKSLSYPDFYATLSRAYAILPSFANGEYYDRKASSTVPAALIAGAPIVANEELLAAYTYLPREATWVQKDGETEMDVVKRVIANRGELAKRRDAVKATRTRLLKENQENAVAWMQEALKRRSWPVTPDATKDDE